MSDRPAVDFDAKARTYDRLRPQDDGWWKRFELMVEAGDLVGRRVLDVGCGTGALVEALVSRAHAKAWGVEPSPEMLSVALGRGVRGAGFRSGTAEHLPFRDGWFDRVVFCLVIHLVDLRASLAEAHRVLGEGGRVIVATFAPDHFQSSWLAPWFPSLPEIDAARFPTPATLEHELKAAGFDGVSQHRLTTTRTLGRAEALARIGGRHISTFELLPHDEVAQGTERAHRELPAEIESTLRHLVVCATR